MRLGCRFRSSFLFLFLFLSDSIQSESRESRFNMFAQPSLTSAARRPQCWECDAAKLVQNWFLLIHYFHNHGWTIGEENFYLAQREEISQGL